jgi:acetate kinase
MTRVLVVNAGSSTLKLRVLDGNDVLEFRQDVDPWHGTPDDEIARLLESAPDVDAVGHRVVHGGHRPESALLDDAVTRELRALSELAPLHQPRALAAVAAVRHARPDVPHVACFDTAFHNSLPAAASTYPLPERWRSRWPIRRFGFHGLSHAWVARRAPELAGVRPHDAKIVSCHLGSGASACAIDGGQSIDTTMGFTPLDGLVMATRPGSLDPGLVVWLLGEGRLTRDELGAGLERHSGLAGVSGTDGDMRHVAARRASGDGAATLAFDLYIHRLKSAVASMAAAMGGIDVLAFTGGVGEHHPSVRGAASAGLGFLGIELDPERNNRATGDGEIGRSGAPVRTVVVTAREDLEIAAQVRKATGTVLR